MSWYLIVLIEEEKEQLIWYFPAYWLILFRLSWMFLFVVCIKFFLSFKRCIAFFTCIWFFSSWACRIGAHTSIIQTPYLCILTLASCLVCCFQYRYHRMFWLANSVWDKRWQPWELEEEPAQFAIHYWFMIRFYIY